MTRLDALVEQESNASRSIRARLRELAQMTSRALTDHEAGLPVSADALIAKANAVSEAKRIHAAIREAVEEA